jgi:hypothetical protein
VLVAAVAELCCDAQSSLKVVAVLISVLHSLNAQEGAYRDAWRTCMHVNFPKVSEFDAKLLLLHQLLYIA